jgi:hypothetical protein
MPAFTFNYITPPPNDELVDEQSQINANLDQIENRLNFLQGIGTWANVDRPKGLEALINDGNQRTAVWNGTAWRTPTGIAGGWTAWQNITLIAPYVASAAGFTPMWRSNSVIRRVQLKGRIANGATGVSMAKNNWTNFSSGASGIPLTFTPANTVALWTTSCSPITASSPAGSEINGARLRVNADATSVRLDFNWMGQDSGTTGNYISLDGMDWWY